MSCEQGSSSQEYAAERGNLCGRPRCPSFPVFPSCRRRFNSLVPFLLFDVAALFGCTGGDAVFSIVGPSSGGFVTATLNTLHALALDLETTARPRRLLYYDVTGAGNFVRAVGETGGTWTVAGGATTATTAGSGVLATSSTVSMTSSSLQMGLDAATGDFYIGDTGGVKIRRIKYSNNSIDDYTASSGNAAGPTIDQTARTAIFVGLSTAGLKECKIDVTTLNAVQLSCASITTMTFTKAHAIAHYYSGAGITNRATYIADNGAHVVRVFSNTGSPTLTIGTSGTATSPVGSAPDTVAATATTLNAPTDVQVDPTNGDVYICDTGNNKIRMVSGGNIYTVAGTGTASTTTVTEGSAAASTAISPKKIAIDAARKLLVFSDQNAKRVSGTLCCMLSCLSRIASLSVHAFAFAPSCRLLLSFFLLLADPRHHVPTHQCGRHVLQPDGQRQQSLPCGLPLSGWQQRHLRIRRLGNLADNLLRLPRWLL